MKAKAGDWIRFHRYDQLVIGVVEYTIVNVLGFDEYHTNLGPVREGNVLEVRSRPGERP